MYKKLSWFVLVMMTTVTIASGKKPGAVGILQPEMTQEDGKWTEPAAKVGQKPSAPWSATTIEAAVNGQALPGTITSRVGEIIDLSCYLQLGKHGAKHKSCAQNCMKNGQPIGLLTEKGDVYVLMPEEHHPRRDGQTTLKESLMDLAADIVEVTGTLSSVGPHKALFVTGYAKPASAPSPSPAAPAK